MSYHQQRPPNNSAAGPNGGTIFMASDIGTLALASLALFGRRHKVIFASYRYGLTALLLLTLLG